MAVDSQTFALSPVTCFTLFFSALIIQRSGLERRANNVHVGSSRYKLNCPMMARALAAATTENPLPRAFFRPKSITFLQYSRLIRL